MHAVKEIQNKPQPPWDYFRLSTKSWVKYKKRKKLQNQEVWIFKKKIFLMSITAATAPQEVHQPSQSVGWTLVSVGCLSVLAVTVRTGQEVPVTAEGHRHSVRLPPGGTLMQSAAWQAVISLLSACALACVCCVCVSHRRSVIEVIWQQNGQELLAQAVLAGGALALV